jgi:uncharacterized protein
MKLSNPVFLKSIFSKGIGLMFKTKINKPYIFIFDKEKIIQLHMWFVFMTIDVIFLDRNKKIVEMSTLKPFTLYTPKKKAMYIIEMPIGSKNKLKLKQKLLF